VSGRDNGSLKSGHLVDKSLGRPKHKWKATMKNVSEK
jgi:hypothetical protein